MNEMNFLLTVNILIIFINMLLFLKYYELKKDFKSNLEVLDLLNMRYANLKDDVKILQNQIISKVKEKKVSNDKPRKRKTKT